jgi:hypothetical protein
MNKFVATVLAIAVLTACASNDKKNSKTLTAALKDSGKIKEGTSSRGSANFKLDYFTSVPDTIDGCGEYLTYDTSTVADKYIFLSDLGSFAIIKVNGRDIYLTRDSVASKIISDKSYISVYKGQGYRAVLTLKEKEAHDEGGFYRGTLQIFSDKVFVMFKVKGEVGC